MRVHTLDGELVEWKINGKEVSLDNRSRSTLHVAARKLLREKYPTLQILEETSILVNKGKTLFLDFYLPILKLAIEVHGEQHFKMSPVFHNTPQDFIKQKKNDSDKENWCEINNIVLKVLAFNNKDDWGKIL